MSVVDYNLIDEVISYDNKQQSFLAASRGIKRYKRETTEFNINLFKNLDTLGNQILNGTYKPGHYHKFKVYIPKEREIHSPSFRDKVAQHMIHSVLREVYEPKFIFDSYACIRDKGNHAAVRRLLHFCRSAQNSYSEPTVVKIDISKFFYTINRSVVINILREDLEEYNPEILISMIEIIKSSPENEISDKLGLPLGNLTSQLLANILMNKVDQYIKNALQIEKYMRYADDLFIIVDGKDKAKRYKDEIENFINTNLKLEINPKKSGVYPISRGIDGLGFITSYKGIRITKRTKTSIKKLMKYINDDYKSGNIDYIHRERQLNSYKSFIGVCGNTRYMDEIIKGNPITYINDRGNYRIGRKYNRFGKIIDTHSDYRGELIGSSLEDELFLYK